MAELDRRDFLKLVGAGAGAAAAAGCSDPVEKLVPYVIQPESFTPGIAVEYASTCQECTAACGLHVKTREGRPIKLEGNPDHPINQGALCARGQASIQRTYHPDRYEGPMAREGDVLIPTTWDEGIASLVGSIQQAGGSKVRVLGGSRGPTLDGLIDQWIGAIGGDPGSQRVTTKTFSDDALRKASGAVFGVESTPLFDLTNADLVIDFGSDFLDTGLSPVEHGRQFAGAQNLGTHKEGGARLVSIGPRMNLTVSSADQWLAAAPGSEGPIALALAKAVFEQAQADGQIISGDVEALRKVLVNVDTADAARASGLTAAEITALAERIGKAKSPVALPPGAAANNQRGTAAAAAVLVLNVVAGAIGRSVKIPEPASSTASNLGDIKNLIADMAAGRVDVLLIHDANPLYTLPADAGFEAALEKVGLVVSLAALADETSQHADLVLPDHTALESWGDAAPRTGVRSIVQPTVRPLHDTQALGDTLLGVGRGLGAIMPEGSFRGLLEAAWSDTNWREALARGGVFSSGGPYAAGAVASSVANIEFRAPQFEGNGDFVLIAYPHSFLGDGSGAALPWMQETPDPVTKAMWTSWAEISNPTAEKLGVRFGEMIAIKTGFGADSINLPVYPRGGVRDDVVAVAVGQGHTVGYYSSLEVDGRPGIARGASVLSILPARTDEAGGQAFLSAKASLSSIESYYRIPISQWTDNQRERELAPEISLLALAKSADAEGHGEGHGEHHQRGGFIGTHFVHSDLGMEAPYHEANDAAPDSPYRWGMVIDNDRCNGCSACVVACSIENNIPPVGQEQVTRHREMSWIRIERYLGDGEKGVGGEERRPHPNGETLGQVNVRHVPMLCQHCGAAPCESVCPVIATYHTPEGLNGMVYNRCVGTRYCANNCTYKVRRFNYFDYGNDNWPGLMALGLNPDVTVRQQGVMEKCTFCVQRIETARQPAKDEGREIRDGEVITACQQTCPTNAITFGNTRDPESAVTKEGEAQQQRSYHSLMVLNTRPAILYLAQANREDDERSHG